MAISWGSWDGHLAVGVEVTRSSLTYTYKWYVGIDGFDYSDSQTLNFSGDIDNDDSVNFTNDLDAGSHGTHQGSVTDYKLVATRTYDATPGEAISVTATLSGSYLGETPSKTYTATAPSIGTPSKPTASSVTSTGAIIGWSLPTYATSVQIQVDDSSGFGSPLADYLDATPPSSPFAVGGDGTPNGTYYARVRGHRAGTYGAWSPTLTFQLDPTAPAAPSSVSASRTSDTSHTITWTRNATSEAPYASQKVQRWDNVSAAWSTMASSVSGSATSYTNNGTRANRKYQWRVQSVNSAGTGTSSASSALYTTPGAPTGAAAAKNASGNIVVSWTTGCSYSEYSTEVYESQDGGAYSLLATVAGPATSYTHVSPSTSVTHRYQVRHKNTTGTTLYSGYSTTGIVTLASPPSAPTSLAPNGTATDAAEDTELTWVHVPTDTSPQSKFQIRHRLVGAGVWTTESEVTSTASEWTLAGATYANGDEVEWQVATWGEHATGSAFSATATITMSTPPTVTIDAPADPLDTSTITAGWTYFDDESTDQSAWRVWLLDDADNELEALDGSGTDAEATFVTRATDGSTYKVQAQVRDGSGLWSDVDEYTFTATFLPPEEIQLIATWDDVLGHVVVALSPQGAIEDETEEAIEASLERRTDGGDWVTIATGLDPVSVVSDTTASTVGTHEYQVVAVTAAGASVVVGSVEFAPNETRWGYLSIGPGYGISCRFFANISISDEAATESAMFHFDRPDDVNFPVAFHSTSASQSVGVTATLESTASLPSEFTAIAHTPSTALVRLPDGTRIFGRLTGISRGQDRSPLAQISFTVDRTRTPANY